MPPLPSRYHVSPGLRSRRILATLLASCLGACTTVGPDYHVPELNPPTDWHTTQADTAATTPHTPQDWWQALNDPLLNQLVAQALRNNQDLGIARARLRQARAERIQAESWLEPTVSLGGSGAATRNSHTIDGSPGGRARLWRAGFDASWELDIFGGQQRAVESANANLAASANDIQALQASLLAELATGYLQLRNVQARQRLAQENIGNLRASEQLAERAWQHGLGTITALQQARAESASVQAQVPLLAADAAQLSHEISVLTGNFPAAWHDALSKPAAQLPAFPALPLSLPSEVIRQRPDLRASERRLAAATAEIGVAEAARLPQFSIPLGLGSATSLLHELFTGASVAWSASLQASQAVHDGGRAQAGVTIAQANTDAARLAYQRDVRQALREVEDALTSLDSARQRQALLIAAVEDSQRAADTDMQRYRSGLNAYLPVLIAQRSANQAREALLLNQWTETRSAISLYKALGMGWQDNEAREPGRQASDGQ